MIWFMFFCLVVAMGNVNNGYANAIIFVAWSVLVYMLVINGTFKDWGDLYLNEPTKSEKRLISSARKYLEPVKTVD